MSSTTKYVVDVLLLVFVLTLADNNTQQQYLNIVQSLSSTATSFILPIAYKHNKWTITSSQPQHIEPSLLNHDNKIISLSLFFNQLSLQQYKNINIQLHIVTLTKPNIKQLTNLFNIIHSTPNIQITNIIIPNSLASQSNIIQRITAYNIPITSYIDYTYTSINAHRNLLSNTTTETNANTERDDSWVCETWPIYVSFFSGILVTIIISLAIKFSMGEHDDDLGRALEKVVHAGIGSSPEDQNEIQFDGDLSVLKVHPPTKATSYTPRNVTPLHTPRSRTGPHALKRAVTEMTLVEHIRNISLDNILTPRHNRKVTFADEKKEKLIKSEEDIIPRTHPHTKSKSAPSTPTKNIGKGNRKTGIMGIDLPKVATSLFHIQSGVEMNLNNLVPAQAGFINATSASRSSTSDELELDENNNDEISELSIQIDRNPLKPTMSVQSNSCSEDVKKMAKIWNVNTGKNYGNNEIEINNVDEMIDLEYTNDAEIDKDNLEMDKDPDILSDTEIP